MTGGKGKGKGKGKKGKGKKGKNKKRADKFEPRSLPDDAITEILLRFPIKSVLRFRCVSKVWCAKIDSTEFKKKHLSYQLARSRSRSRSRSRYDENDFLVVNREYFMSSPTCSCQMNVLSCYDDYKSLAELNSSCELDIKSMHFDSCSYNINGIVCVIRDPCCNVYLCNPALREIRQLPSIPAFSARLGITASVKTSAVGIGFDDAADDYVLVKFVHDGGDSDAHDLKCVSYHVKAKSWTMIKVPPFVFAYASGLKKNYASTTKLYASFFSHGCIHWCMDWRHLILTLNTTTRSFQEMEFPHGWKDYGYDEYLYLLNFDSCSSIALFGFRGHDLHNIDIWVMKEYGVADSWTKQYFISNYTIPGSPQISRPLCFWRKDKIFMLAQGSRLICYDLGKGRLHEPPLRGQCERLPDTSKDYMKGLKLFPVMSGGKKKYIILPDPDADPDTDPDTDTDTDDEPPRRGQDDTSGLPHPNMTPLEVVTCSGSLVSVYQS